MAAAASFNQQEKFQPPDFWYFKPFFTLQPVRETQEKQLKLWKEVILKYCSATNCYRVHPNSLACFHNEEIERHLSPDGVQAVVNFLIQEGNAEWEDEGHTSLMIMWKSPELLGQEIYTWASKKVELLGTVFTIYELYAGDEYEDSGFHGTDPVLLRKALHYLETVRKCKIIPGASPEEDGVKFLATA
eukprot:gene10241-11335_t